MSDNKQRTDHKGVFATVEAAKAVTPPSSNFKVFGVADPTGKQVYTWSWGGDNAIANAARAAGWTAWSAESKAGGPVTKERVAAKLAEFTDEELAAMGLTRKTAAPPDEGIDLSASPPADDDAGTQEAGRKGRRGRKSAETDAQ